MSFDELRAELRCEYEFGRTFDELVGALRSFVGFVELVHRSFRLRAREQETSPSTSRTRVETFRPGDNQLLYLKSSRSRGKHTYFPSRVLLKVHKTSKLTIRCRDGQRNCDDKREGRQ